MTEFEERARELGRRHGAESTTPFEHDLDILLCQNHTDVEFLTELRDLGRKHNLKPAQLRFM